MGVTVCHKKIGDPWYRPAWHVASHRSKWSIVSAAVISSGTQVLDDICAVLLVWRQIKPFHSFVFYFLNVCFNIILPSTLGVIAQSCPFKFLSLQFSVHLLYVECQRLARGRDTLGHWERRLMHLVCRQVTGPWQPGCHPGGQIRVCHYSECASQFSEVTHPHTFSRPTNHSIHRPTIT